MRADTIFSGRLVLQQGSEHLDPLNVGLGIVFLLMPILALVNVGLWYALGRELKSNHPRLWEELVPASERGRLKFLWSGAYLTLGNRRITIIGRMLKIASAVFLTFLAILVVSVLFRG